MKKGLITSILALTFSGLQAQVLPVLPKLVVTLTVDQLRTDYMEAFSSLYGEQGFKRLMREGKVFSQMNFSFEGADRASAIAAICTGSTPSVNGIIAENWMDVHTLRPVNCVDDSHFMGNYTDESTSPSRLLTSTLADELKIATQNKALVYAIAPFSDAAIFSAGHSGNGAFWLNANTGKWCSTTYYNEFPWWLSQYNENQSPDFRIGEMVWTPLLPIGRYTLLPGGDMEAFKYKPDNDRVNKYRRLASSPFINDEINRLVKELLDKSTLGQDEATDMLALTYYAGKYNLPNARNQALEIQDTYVRLDRSIASLLDMLDSKIGLQNILFCLTSTGYTPQEEKDVDIYRIPGGEFHLNRCATLLNMYLMATYGEGQYVEAYYDQQIYLNHKLIEDKRLNLSEIQEKAAEFLVQFSGVNEVYSAHRLLLGPWSPQIERMRNAYHRKYSGDLRVEILPGWTIVNENGTSHTVRNAEPAFPIILMGQGIKAETVRIPVCAERIAPTLAGLMRIRSPNACTVQPLD